MYILIISKRYVKITSTKGDGGVRSVKFLDKFTPSYSSAVLAEIVEARSPFDESLRRNVLNQTALLYEVMTWRSVRFFLIEGATQG